MIQKKNKKRGLIILLLLIVMSVSATLSIFGWLKDKRAREEYERLAELAREASTAVETTAQTSGPEPETEPEEQPYVSPINFAELKKENPDTVGWIRIDGTRIDYPIVQGTDNDYYLHHDFYGEESAGGAIYLDFESQKDFVGRNNILYGHHMKNGTMFKDVNLYKEPEFFKEHQYFSIYTPDREIRLKAVACYYGEAKPIIRKTRFGTQESFDSFVKEMMEPCSYKEEIAYPVRTLYTLVTCSYEINDARTFLFAVEVDEDKNEIGVDDAFRQRMDQLIKEWVEEQEASRAHPPEE